MGVNLYSKRILVYEEWICFMRLIDLKYYSHYYSENKIKAITAVDKSRFWTPN